MNHSFSLHANVAHKRLDVFLAKELNAISRTKIQQWIREGCVSINGEMENRIHRTVQAGDEVHVRPPDSAEPGGDGPLKPAPLPLSILLEDEHLLVINKAAGHVVHPGPGHDTGTVAHAFVHHCPESAQVGDPLRPGIVHRLDADTSGILVLAKTDDALAELQKQFKNRATQKAYRALVHGSPRAERFTIRTHMGRHPVDRKKQIAERDGGREAISHFQVLERFPTHPAAHLEVHIETGRTHQIRVHAAHHNLPILGDSLYAGKRAQLPEPMPWVPRQMLHAFRLRFTHPARMLPVEIEAPLPSDFLTLLDALRTSPHA